MDLTLLRSLLAVADAGSITGAAERLDITQPALSRRIAHLEKQFGVPLLARGRKGATLTALGNHVLPHARLMVDRYERLLGEVAAQAEMRAGTIRIGGGATAVSFVLPDAIAGYQREYPQVRFEVRESGSREVAESVRDGRLELGIVTLPVPAGDLEIHPLLEDRIVLIAAADDELVTRRRITAPDLDGRGFVGFEAGSAIRQLIDESLRSADLNINVVMELRSIPAIVRMVISTRNLAFVSSLGVANEPHVRTLQVPGLKIRRRLAVLTRPQAELSPAAASFKQRLLIGRTDPLPT